MLEKEQGLHKVRWNGVDDLRRGYTVPPGKKKRYISQVDRGT